MVLLVGEIAIKNNYYIVELSDGWRSVYFEVKFETSFKLDKNSMTNNQLLYSLLKSKKLYSGQKIHISGMKVLRRESGHTINMGEETEERVYVEVSYNSISRAKWDEKLGLSRTKYILKNLISLRNNGGIIPMIDVFIIKKYKILEKGTGIIK